jgi:hypothetical protein
VDNWAKGRHGVKAVIVASPPFFKDLPQLGGWAK